MGRTNRRNGTRFTGNEMEKPGPPPDRVPIPPTTMHDGILGLLNHPVRIDLLDRLSQQSECVTTLAEALDLSLDNITYHLRLLWEEKLIWFEREKRSHIYHVNSGVRFKRTKSTMTAVLQYEDDSQLHVEIRRT